MRTGILLIMLFLGLSACSVARNAAPVSPVVIVPRSLSACPQGVPPRPPPPVPRTTETIAAAYNEQKVALETTYAALQECEAKLKTLYGTLPKVKGLRTRRKGR